MTSESYIYKKEADWSLFNYGFAIPYEHQVIFSEITGRFIGKGESKDIRFYLNGKEYPAKLINIDFNTEKFGNHKDIIQVRYSAGSEIAAALRSQLHRSFEYISNIKTLRGLKDKSHINLPDEVKEYIAMYTTEYDDLYILEIIASDEIAALHEMVQGKTERVLEEEFNYDITDDTAGFEQIERVTRIRKLNRKIGDNLKLLYNYRCQICGRLIGEEYGSHACEAHHIDYFVNSLNNDASNQMIVCPNHHSIIHEVNPVFDRNTLTYIYENGYKEQVRLNLHL